jgi:hypothetical protein
LVCSDFFFEIGQTLLKAGQEEILDPGCSLCDSPLIGRISGEWQVDLSYQHHLESEYYTSTHLGGIQEVLDADAHVELGPRLVRQ